MKARIPNQNAMKIKAAVELIEKLSEADRKAAEETAHAVVNDFLENHSIPKMTECYQLMLKNGYTDEAARDKLASMYEGCRVIQMANRSDDYEAAVMLNDALNDIISRLKKR